MDSCEVRSRISSEGTREKHDTSWSGQPVTRPRFEPRSAQIRSRNATHSTFPALYATRLYIAEFTRACHWFLSCSRRTHKDIARVFKILMLSSHLSLYPGEGRNPHFNQTAYSTTLPTLHIPLPSRQEQTDGVNTGDT